MLAQSQDLFVGGEAGLRPELGDEPDAPQPLRPLRRVVVEQLVGPAVGAEERLGDHEGGAHRQGESLADDRGVVTGGVADEHAAVRRRTVDPRVLAAVGGAGPDGRPGPSLRVRRHGDLRLLDQPPSVVDPPEGVLAGYEVDAGPVAGHRDDEVQALAVADHQHVVAEVTHPADEHGGDQVRPLGAVEG